MTKLKVTAKNNKKWITSEIIATSKRLKDMHRNWKLTGDQNVLRTYKGLKTSYVRLINLTKREYNDNLIRKSNNINKAVWNLINGLSGGQGRRKEKSDITIIHDGRYVRDLLTTSKIFNDHFIESAALIADEFSRITNAKYVDLPRLSSESFFLNPVTEAEVFNTITQLSKKKSAGADGIPCHILYNIAGYIVKPLSHMINDAFSSGYFPDTLKIARVVPVFKKGNVHDITNYRPISLVSVFSKLFEKCIANRLINYLTKYKLLFRTQHGFIKGKSTVTALFDSITRIYEALDNKQHVIGIYFDLSKAFDIVNHNILLKKLESYGITGIPLKLLSSFLTGRSQFVELSGKFGNVTNHKFKSSELDYKIGTPQGSTLAPLLFAIFVNDLDRKFNDPSISLCKYADDTSLVISDPNLDTLAQKACDAITRIREWCDSNQLKLNETKTGVVSFCNSRNNQAGRPNIIMNGKLLRITSGERFLGVTVSDNLNWSSHIDQICSKLRSACYAIICLRPVVGQSALLKYYYAQVQSQLHYAIIIWGNSNATVRLLLLQKRIVRHMCNSGMRDHCKPLFKRLQIMTVYSLYIYNCVQFVFDNSYQFTTNEEIRSCDRKTRFGSKLTVPRHKTTLFENSPKYMCIKLFNSLPIDLLKCNQASFMSKVKTFFLDNPFYSISEYLCKT
uniref:Reverse transcriptase domain-containing protein n=1 Tax=Photinus pyralis TaxID=7054 RepID=A0A1Y1MDM8_PHOPY